jgi:hypothetical protein
MLNFTFRRWGSLWKGLPEISTVLQCKLLEQLLIPVGNDQSIHTWMRFSRRRGVYLRSFNVALGVDAATRSKSNKKMREWFKQLSTDEQDRRTKFKTQFAGDYRGFRSRRLSEVRHNIEHRTGVAPVTVTIKGAFGDTHKGSPTQQVPISETRQMDDPTAALLLAKPHPIQPRWSDFEIEGKPLFAECREHLDAAIALVAQGRKIADLVHGTGQVSIPPIY